MAQNALRIGGIGTGVIFNHAHLPALIRCNEVELVGIYDRNPEAAERTVRHHAQLLREFRDNGEELAAVAGELRVFGSAEELYRAVDAVTVCTHPRYHPVYSVAAMEAGCHVMSEKPMARTWLEADHVHQVAQKTGKLFQLNDDNVWLERFRRLRNIVESNMVGPVQHMWISRGSHGLEGPVFGSWFWDRIESGGGCILDYGAHAMTAVLFVLGFDKEPAEIRSLGIRNMFRTRNVGGRYMEVDNDDNAQFKVRLVDPNTGDWQNVIVEATWSGPHLGRGSSLMGNGDVNGYLEVECAEGTITAANDPKDNGTDYFVVRHRAFGERIVPFKYAAGETASFQAEVLNFALSVRANARPIISTAEGVKVMSVLNAAALSELRGRVTVTIEDLRSFSTAIAAGTPDIWEAATAITDQLTSVSKRR